MKKLIAFTFLTLLFLSCSNDDESKSNPIVANWTIEKYGYMSETYQIESEFDWSSDCATKKDNVVFDSSNEFTLNYFSSACEATFFAQENGSYDLDASNDVVTFSGGTDWDGDYEIITLTDTDLVLKRIPSSSVLSRLGDVNFYKFSRN